MFDPPRSYEDYRRRLDHVHYASSSPEDVFRQLVKLCDEPWVDLKMLAKVLAEHVAAQRQALNDSQRQVARLHALLMPPPPPPLPRILLD